MSDTAKLPPHSLKNASKSYILHCHIKILTIFFNHLSTISSLPTF